VFDKGDKEYTQCWCAARNRVGKHWHTSLWTTFFFIVYASIFNAVDIGYKDFFCLKSLVALGPRSIVERLKKAEKKLILKLTGVKKVKLTKRAAIRTRKVTGPRNLASSVV